MHAEKLSISLSVPLIDFINNYQKEHACKSKSQVVQTAIKLLQEKELEKFYLAANSETDHAFDNTVADGLEDETW